MSDLKLFRYTDGCVDYWVAAYTAAEVPALVEAVEGQGSIEPEMFEVQDEPQERAAKLKLTTDGEPPCTMWEGFVRTKQPEVIACSEWP